MLVEVRLSSSRPTWISVGFTKPAVQHRVDAPSKTRQLPRSQGLVEATAQEKANGADLHNGTLLCGYRYRVRLDTCWNHYLLERRNRSERVAWNHLLTDGVRAA